MVRYGRSVIGADFTAWWKGATPGMRRAAAANLQREANIAAAARAALAAPARCSVCSFKVGNISKHIAWHKGQRGPVLNIVDDALAGPVVAASAAARQRARRAKARALIRPSPAQRQAALRQRARAILGADDWTVYFKGLRRLNTIRNTRRAAAFEATGDPFAFNR